MTAADKLRSLAQAAQPGPWHRTGDPVVGGHWVVQADRDSTVCAVTAHYEQSVKDADYIAAMSPDVALALADLLDAAARMRDADIIVAPADRPISQAFAAAVAHVEEVLG